MPNEPGGFESLDGLRSNVVVDNRDGRQAGAWLGRALAGEEWADIMTAYFSPEGWASVQSEIECIQRARVLIGSPELAVSGGAGRHDYAHAVGEDGVLSLRQALSVSAAARACREWVLRPTVEVRGPTGQWTHAKLYMTGRGETCSSGLIGSSNWTASGMGTAEGGGNREGNHVLLDGDERAAWRAWFDTLWDECEDRKSVVASALERAARRRSPEFIYYLTLFRVFHDRIHALLAEEETHERLHGLSESLLWADLYRFQKDAVVQILHRLQTENGMLLADSVGLGKTLIGLGVAAWFLERKGDVLVLCPKRLEANWRQYQGSEASGNRYGSTTGLIDVRAHTDLLRWDEENERWAGVGFEDWAPDRYALIIAHD